MGEMFNFPLNQEQNKIFTLTIYFQHCTGNFSFYDKTREKDTKFGMQKVKLSQFANYIIVYIDDT
jgi:hypothetical protein